MRSRYGRCGSLRCFEMSIRVKPRDGFGDVFPPLPESLFSPGESSGRRGKMRKSLLCGQDLNPGPSGYEPTEEATKQPESPQIVAVTPPLDLFDPPPNPADPRRPDSPGRLPDDSMNQPRLAALARAARALVGVDDARVGDLLDDLLRTLEDGDRNVVTLAAKRTTRR
jgi:hypothetical protein